MRILYLSQYFPPEAGATQTRALEMARNLVLLGHSVTVIGEFPNHPSGIIPPAYRGKLYERSTLDGIDVIRVWVKASPVKNFRNRMLFYLSYMLTAALAGLFLARSRYDVIYASSPPLFVGGAALAISYLRRIPLAFEVRDLWPESAVALGELTNPRAVALASRLEEACYRRARTIVVVTKGIRDRLIGRGYPQDKIVLIPNGANVDLFRYDSTAREKIRSDLNLGDSFTAVYAGIHGVAQGLETLVEAAKLLRDHPGIRILLIGEGPTKAQIAALVEKYALPNLIMLPEQPRESIPGFLSAVDAAIIPLKAVDLFKGALPSKLFDAWACQRPVLLSVDGEAHLLLDQAEGGIFVHPEDPQALASALVDLSRRPADCRQMGINGRRFTEAHYSRKALAGQLEAHLREKISPVSK
jgi:glycosyltransferase involved in cell wall biosynthesis